MNAFALKTKFMNNNKLKYIASSGMVSAFLAVHALGFHPALAAASGQEAVAQASQKPVSMGAYLSGRYAQSIGDNNSAYQYLQRVYDQDPSNLSVATQLQNTLLQEGKIDDAFRVAESISELNPKEPIAALLLSLRAMKKEQYDEAAKILEAMDDGSGKQLWLPLVMGWVDVGQGSLKKPMTVEGLSADVGRAAAIVNYHLALINAGAGFTEAAANNFKESVADIKTPPGRMMEAMVRFYEQHGQPPVLKNLVENYTKTYPEGLGSAITQPIDTIDDGVAEILFTMGSIMMAGDVAQDAVAYFQMALYIKPDFAMTMLTLGDAYSEMQQYARSSEIYARVPKESPFYLSAQLHIAMNQDLLGDRDGSLARLNAMAKQLPQNVDVHVARGDLLRKYERYSEAVDSYTRVIAIIGEPKPRQWPLFFARGVAYERLQEWANAEKDFRKALELNPNQPDVLNYLAYGWLERGENKQEAKTMLEAAVKARPNDPQILDSMGWALYLLGNYEEAVYFLERSLEKLPHDATINSHLGDAYWQVGRKTEARFQWERSLSFQPDSALTEALNKKLKEGLPPVKVAETARTENHL